VLLLHSLPLAFQLAPAAAFRLLGLLLAVFLVSQSLLGALLIDHDYHTLPPDLDVIIDVRGDLPGVRGRHHVTTDGQGFRVTKNVDYSQKQPGTVRIFAVGGSTTEQAHIDDRKTWTHLLQRKMEDLLAPAKVEIINTGLSGLRARHHVATLRRIASYEPDVVIFLLGFNDWNRHIKDALGSPLDRALEELKPYSFKESWAGRRLRRARRHLRAALAGTTTIVETGEYYARRSDSLSRPEKRLFAPESVSREYALYLDRLADVCREEGFLCVFSTQPSAYREEAPEEMRRRFWMTPLNEPYTLDFPSMIRTADLYNDHLVNFASERRVGICDTAAEMPPSTEYFYDDCHFNVGGAALFADLMAGCLSDQYREALRGNGK
jgi:lysophospholipase L1-like esterase